MNRNFVENTKHLVQGLNLVNAGLCLAVSMVPTRARAERPYLDEDVETSEDKLCAPFALWHRASESICKERGLRSKEGGPLTDKFVSFYTSSSSQQLLLTEPCPT